MMIKKLWFIRNERKLINSLSFTIAGFMLCYSLLTIWALAKKESSGEVLSLMLKRVDLIFLPVISLLFCSVLFWLSNHTKSSKFCMDEHSKALQKQIKRDLFIGTNLYITLGFAFWQVNRLNFAKQIGQIGLSPIYVCTIGILIFYAFTIKKLLNFK